MNCRIQVLTWLPSQLDYVGLSFVQNAEDILRLRRFWEARLKPGQRLPLIVAKIEKPQALDNLDAIMAARFPFCFAVDIGVREY